ncbi:uncharacterized protein LOC129760362 [Uranotaenia lowii]|uniref:uncharacterized protein LOC129760362 n=1 Tax=Uranotaenia lowii TaxID=190385 RepID=UPI00247A13FE|nr:uncharacterized protein LOC129760362 [Uranotaenia lowii]
MSQYVCRFCMRGTDSTEHIFKLNKTLDLAGTVQQCLGLNVSSPTAQICTNCKDIIHMIDEFRSLCQRSNAIFEAFQVKAYGELEYWRYQQSITEIRHFIQKQSELIPIPDLSESDFNLVETLEEEENDQDTSATTFTEVLIKQEPPKAKNKKGSKQIKEAPATPFTKTKSGVALKIARLVRERLPQFIASIQAGDNFSEWTFISYQLDLGEPELEKIWDNMKTNYRMQKRQQETERSEQGRVDRWKSNELFNLMDQIMAGLAGIEKVDREPQDTVVIASTSESASERTDVLSVELKLKITEEMKKYPEMWDTEQECSATRREILWEHMATSLQLETRTLQLHWRRIRENYRSYVLRRVRGPGRRVISTDERFNRLVELLQEMYGDLGLSKQLKREEAEKRTEAGNYSDYEESYQVDKPDDSDAAWYREEETKSRKFDLPEAMKNLRRNRYSFAKAIHDNEILWNKNHPNNDDRQAKDDAWKAVAKNFNSDITSVKSEWHRLRTFHTERFRRFISGLLNENSPAIKHPLYQLLDKMFGKDIRLGVRGGSLKMRLPRSGNEEGESSNSALICNLVSINKKPGRRRGIKGPFGCLENCITLATEIAKHELLWNITHPKYTNRGERGRIWEQVGREITDNQNQVKVAWMRLRKFYRDEKLRRSNAEPTPEMGKYHFEDEDDNRRLFEVLDSFLVAVTDPEDGYEMDLAGAKQKKRSVSELIAKRRSTICRKYADEGCIKVVKNGIVRYQKVCEICGLQVERSRYEFHMNRHNGLTPYACSFKGCGKSYANRTTRNRHEVMDHSQEGFFFECDQCDAKYKQRAKFDYHYAIKHKSAEVSCDLCGKVFRHPKVLTRHKRDHKMSFSCNVCGKILVSRYSLNVHMRIHTQEKPFPCSLCDQRFMLKVQLKTHVLNVHGLHLDALEAPQASSSEVEGNSSSYYENN